MNDNVVQLHPKAKRISDAELYGLHIGAKLNASILTGQNKELWEGIASAMEELQERRKAQKWENRDGQ